LFHRNSPDNWIVAENLSRIKAKKDGFVKVAVQKITYVSQKTLTRAKDFFYSMGRWKLKAVQAGI